MRNIHCWLKLLSRTRIILKNRLSSVQNEKHCNIFYLNNTLTVFYYFFIFSYMHAFIIDFKNVHKTLFNSYYFLWHTFELFYKSILLFLKPFWWLVKVFYIKRKESNVSMSNYAFPDVSAMQYTKEYFLNPCFTFNFKIWFIILLLLKIK